MKLWRQAIALLLISVSVEAGAESVIRMDSRTDTASPRSVDIVISKPTGENKQDFVFLSQQTPNPSIPPRIAAPASGNSLLFDVDPVTFSHDFPVVMQDAQLSLITYRQRHGQTKRGFEVGIASRYAQRNAHPHKSVSQDYAPVGPHSQLYNLGLNMGYAGFKIGASYSRQQDHFKTAYQGFDLGFGYYGNSWSTNIQFAEYHRERDLLFSFGDAFYDQLYAVEVGAAYLLVPGVTFSGRFKYYDYDQNNTDESGPEDVHIFMLGTNVNF